ncbi:hypothetical protein MATR_28300 [Marivirga tractuosa]|uniref:Uncharacterized protein n=1 Tax=Marivirga tractuosa (strain ATCC 23168 / DSM 4126 / NBRC 15989 / NCIMB 1408 / VKM B-1430 / H-43) TaxID=643867 RepID=E4TL44_MARTH|nr:hypothetical protein Ftrac_3347 [Marivirga tractuosa DSM 4126]BDD16005.1 hypothetical protein MATR_28300 [Marivirga tractuosa]
MTALFAVIFFINFTVDTLLFLRENEKIELTR